MPAPPDPARCNRLAADCRRCPELVESRTCIAWGNGPLDAALLVVGEAPGAGDPEAGIWQGGNRTGMAYTSRHSGRRIRSLLADVGYGRRACYFTNAVKCFPGDGTGTNRAPTAAERANCRPYLRRELDQVDPSVIVPTGAHATRSVLALADRTPDGFLERVLTVIECRKLDAPVVPLLHPSYMDVWLPRIEHTPRSYRAALARTLADLDA